MTLVTVWLLISFGACIGWVACALMRNADTGEAIEPSEFEHGWGSKK